MGNNYLAHAPMNSRERIVFALLYSIIYLISLLPFPILYFLSDILYFLVYDIVGYRKKIVRKNLCNSFPEKKTNELSKIERGFYHFLCDYIFETIKEASINKEEMKRRVKFTGLENIYKALDEGHNVALYLAHYCNWEWMTSLMLHIPYEIYGGQVYHVLQNKIMDKLLLKLRSRMGTINISQHELLHRVAEQSKLKIPMVIGFLSDQAPEMHTIRYWTEFLNQDTAIITGTEAIAKKYDFACMFLFITRPSRGYYNINIENMTLTPAEHSNYEITEMYARALERNIRQQPENWLWTHNRWKRTRKNWEEFLATHKNNR